MKPLPTEILSMIARMLTCCDMYKLILLNKEWNDIWISYLYQTVRLATRVQHRRFHALLAFRHINMVAKYIKILIIQQIEILIPMMELFLAGNTRLSPLGLEVLAHRKLLNLSSSEDHTLITFLKENRQLHHLIIRRVPQDASRYMTVIPDYLPNLQTLHLFDAVGVQHPFVLRDAAIKFLSSCPQTLRHLSVAWTILPYDEEDIRDHNSEKTSLSIQNPHPELKFLSVRTTPDATNDNGYLSDFVATCPKLQCIINPTVDEEQIEKFINNGRSLQQALLKVTEIRFKELHVPKTQEDNSVIAEMINEIHDPLILMDTVQQCWHTISIKEIVKEHSDLILDAILKSCQGLVRLHVPQGEWISSRKIQSILCCAKDLRIFHAVRPPVLYAQDFISSKWSCRWLTVLSIQILGIPRPDIVSDRLGRERALADREAEGTMSASRALQRKVYQQLGLLTHLEFLDLGIHVSSSLGEDLIDVGGIIFDRQFQLDCLEMSLESGLDLLSSLQNLRSLRVVGMEHRIGIEELKWMLVHFLRLESLKGVNPEICYLPLYVRPTRIYKPEPEVEQWLTTQKYTWVLVE